MSLISGTKTDDGLRVPGQRGQWSSAVVSHTGGSRRRRSGGGGGQSSQQRMEERTGADLREFVIAENVYGERQEPPPTPIQGWQRGDAKTEKYHHTRCVRALSSERVDLYFSQLVPPLLSLSKIGTQQLQSAGEKKTLKFVCSSQICQI